MNAKPLLFVTTLSLFVACSSPGSDGKKTAEKFCDCKKESVENRQKDYSELIQNFDSYGFQTRIAVRKKSRILPKKPLSNTTIALKKRRNTTSKRAGNMLQIIKKIRNLRMLFKATAVRM